MKEIEATPFDHLKPWQLNALALQAIKLKENLDVWLVLKDRTFIFNIDWYLNYRANGSRRIKRFLPEKLHPIIPIIATWHYWLPTKEAIGMILDKVGCSYDIYNGGGGTYSHFFNINTLSLQKTEKDQQLWGHLQGQGFFTEHALMDGFIQLCRRHGKEVGGAINALVREQIINEKES